MKGYLRPVTKRNSFGYTTVEYQVEDSDIDNIYKTLTNLEIDVEKKIDELDEEYSKLEDEYQPLSKKFWEMDDQGPGEDVDSDSEVYKKWRKEYDDLEETVDDLVRRMNAIEETKDSLKDLLDRIK